MRRRGVGAIAASPTLVGAITTLIVILAIFLAYNANNGLPFVPSYRISVQVPNANTLVPGNDVRIGGVQIGFVESVEPIQDPQTGAVHAKVDLKLNKSIDPLPKDSSVVVRSKSALGLKYLEINKGTSKQGYPEGAVLSLKAAHPHPVEIDTVLNTFDPATRHAAQENLVAFGDALAGRGADLNAALGELQPLVAELEPVARNLASKKTGLGRFFTALANTAAEVAPVAEVQADMFVALDSTFGAFARVARPFIQDTISETPPTLDTLTRTAPRIRTFLGHSATLFADLRPGIKSLERELAGDRLRAGDRRERAADAPQLNAQLAPTAKTLEAFGADHGGQRRAFRRSTQLFDFLTPTLRFVAPAQTFCNYPTLLLRNAQNLLSLGDGIGTWQRFIVMSAGQINAGAGIAAPNSENSPSSAPANGPAPAPRTSCTSTRTRTPRRPGSRTSARPATRSTSRTRSWSATRPCCRTRPGSRADESPASKAAGPVKRDPSNPGPDERIFGRHYRGPSPVAIGLVVAILFVIGFYLAFTKHIPFTGQGYELHATFENATTLKPDSPVRIAGVNVGKVTDVQREGQHGRGDLHDRRPGPADPPGRDDHDPSAPLPRGQLLPRPAAGQPERPRPLERADDPGHPDGHRGSDRPGAHLAAEGHPQQPPEGARGLRRDAEPGADRGRERHPGPRASRA